MPRVRVVLESPLSAEAALATAYDFSPRRAMVFPAVSMKRLTVHERGDTWAEVTEGTRAGPVVNWERCRYDWSQPGYVRATVMESNIYAAPGSSWEMRATGGDGGSRVEMTWDREFRRGPRAGVFGFFFGWQGDRIFGKYARDVLRNRERLEHPSWKAGAGQPPAFGRF